MCYEMIAGYSPFADLENMDQVKICQNIVKGKLTFPKGFNQACKVSERSEWLNKNAFFTSTAD